ncbi:MAG: four helix bundle protein [Chloroflexi bacterium]|nr:four helix bundle protein [Chloroflexota bacterium]
MEKFVNFQEWLTTVSPTLRGDTLWKMKVYQVAVFVGDLAWPDVTKLMNDRRTIGLSNQLYEAIGSISANLAEGYSRSSGKDRARFYEYSLGSARESRDWYNKGRHILGAEVAEHRMQLLTQIIKLLLTITPEERTRTIREEEAKYYTQSELTLDQLLEKAPLS